MEPWKGYNKGIVWEKDEESAWAEAKKSRKLVLYFELVGDLDMEGC